MKGDPSLNAICDQTVGQNNFFQKIDPNYFFNLGGGLFSEIFPFDAPFGHKWHLKKDPPPFSAKIGENGGGSFFKCNL